MDRNALRPLLILDLDETLIHGSEVRLHRDPDFMIGPFYIYKRPYLEEFLQITSTHYDVAIWSSATPDYVDGIARELSGFVPKWQFVWNCMRCIQRRELETMQTYFVKDLKKVKRLGYDLDRVLIVDHTRLKLSRNYGNAIYISPFEGADDDGELFQLTRYIDSLRSEPNFRRIEKRGWRHKNLSD